MYHALWQHDAVISQLESSRVPLHNPHGFNTLHTVATIARTKTIKKHRKNLHNPTFSLNFALANKQQWCLHSQTSNNGAIAQLVEQRTENPCVTGSIPVGTT